MLIRDLSQLDNYIKKFNVSGNTNDFLDDLEILSYKTSDSFYPYIIRSELGTKIVRSMEDKSMQSILNYINQLSSIDHKKILDNIEFINTFYNILWPMLQGLGYSTQNIHQFIPSFVGGINKITRPGYIVYDCRSTDVYNCGRAMIPIIGKSKTKLLIFNTDDSSQMDPNIYLDFNSQRNEHNLTEHNLNKQTYNIGDWTHISRIINENYKYPKRILKELEQLGREYDVSIDTISLNITLNSINNNDITFIIKFPEDYPHSPPSGIFNGLTISDVDNYKYNWTPIKNLKIILKNILNKYYNNYYLDNNINLKVPTKTLYDKYAENQ
jgi:hypothetical protein